MNGIENTTQAGFFSPLIRLGARSERSIARHERLYLLLGVGVFTLFAAIHACIFPLWFDELFTLFISRLSSLPDMLRAMPADGQPPLSYLVTRLSLRLFGESELAIRLPELLAYMAAGSLTYKIARRHGTPIQALFALALLLGAVMGIQQAYTARPYGLLITFTALMFASWQAAALRQHRRFLPLCGVALGISGAILSHHFGVMHVGLPLAAGETARLIRRRRIDGWMITAIAAGLSPLALTMPMMRQSRLQLGNAILNSTVFWAKPSITDLLTYWEFAAHLLLCIVAILAILFWLGRSAASPSTAPLPVPVHEWAAVAALSLLLPVQLSLASFQTGYFLPRYAVSTSLGLALLLGWALPRLRLGGVRLFPQPVLALGAICFLLLVATSLLLSLSFEPPWHAQPGAKAVSPLLRDAPPGLPIVVASSFDFAPEWWYSPPYLQQRLIYLTDTHYALQQPNFLGDLSLKEDQAYIPLPTADYAAFIGAHPHFLLLCTREPQFNWVPSRLTNSGWRLTPIARNGTDVLYQVDRP